MHPKTAKRKRSSRRALQSEHQNASLTAGLERLSTVLAEYGAATEEGAVDKLSRLAREIVEIITHNRKKVALQGYYRRRIE
jgi:septum formation topological specificity factor MinE